MKTMQEEMKKWAKELEIAMNLEIAKFANIRRKGYMGENVVMLDFNKSDFEAAKVVANEISNKPNFRTTIYNSTNRIVMIF